MSYLTSFFTPDFRKYGHDEILVNHIATESDSEISGAFELLLRPNKEIISSLPYLTNDTILAIEAVSVCRSFPKDSQITTEARGVSKERLHQILPNGEESSGEALVFYKMTRTIAEARSRNGMGGREAWRVLQDLCNDLATTQQ